MAPIVPSSSAGPAEVRKYLIHLLMTKHDVAKEAAEEIASHWDIARGSVTKRTFAAITTAQWAILFATCLRSVSSLSVSESFVNPVTPLRNVKVRVSW
ncbi:hypothetical protein MW887_011554 [Aspergillus wentii]|nr:hypothetical protein MW887_011554 [Aspergillus wentii]